MTLSGSAIGSGAPAAYAPPSGAVAPGHTGTFAQELARQAESAPNQEEPAEGHGRSVQPANTNKGRAAGARRGKPGNPQGDASSPRSRRPEGSPSTERPRTNHPEATAAAPAPITPPPQDPQDVRHFGRDTEEQPAEDLAPAASSEVPPPSGAADPAALLLAFSARITSKEGSPSAPPATDQETPAPATQTAAGAPPAAASDGAARPVTSAPAAQKTAGQEDSRAGGEDAEPAPVPARAAGVQKEPAEKASTESSPATPHAAEHQPEHGGGLGVVVAETNAQAHSTPSSNSSAHSSEVSQPSALELDPKQSNPVSPKGLRDLAVRLSDGKDERVDVRVTERSGEVRVSVRSSDADLAHNLRDGLSSLVGRLENKGYQTEVFRPGESSADHRHSDRGGSQRERWPQGGQKKQNGRSGWADAFASTAGPSSGTH